MRVLFVRVATVLLVTLLLGIGLIVYVAVSSYQQQLIDQHVATSKRVHAILTQDLSSEPESKWPEIVNRTERLLDFRIEIAQVRHSSSGVQVFESNFENQVPVTKHRSLSVLEDEVSTVLPIASSNARFIRYTRVYSTKYENEDVLLMALLFVALPLVLYLTLLPIARKITELSFVAREYAIGRLDTRSLLPAPEALEQLADDVHKMARALQLKIREQGVMMQAISHELKTPLTRIRMAHDLVLRESDVTLVKRFLSELDDDLTLLEKVMGETLTLTRLTFQDVPLSLAAIPLGEIVDESLRECIARDIDVAVDISPEARVSANRDALKRVMVNLLSNAYRFAKKRVRITAIRQQGQWLTTIEDDGPGIASEDRERIFMPFGRAETSRSRATGSTGMGLAIAALLIEKCNGSISLDKENSAGARFLIALTASGSHD